MKKTLIALAISAVSIASASAQDLTINFTNLTHGSHFTPLLFGAHSADQHLFQIATSASDSLQAMAEGGSISALVDDLTALNADVISSPPPGGATAPGQTVTFDLTTQALNTHLSMTAMVLPSNDGFVGLDALAIPTMQAPKSMMKCLQAWLAALPVLQAFLLIHWKNRVKMPPVSPIRKTITRFTFTVASLVTQIRWGVPVI